MAIEDVLGGLDPARKSTSEIRMKDVKRKCVVPAKAGGKPDLMDVRVVQRRLVYAVGLAADICSDQVLKSTDYFGKYGKIKKISVTWSNHASPARQATAAAYVLFHGEEDAWNCIQAIDGVKWSGKQVRACFGTTKYCHAYLRNAACTNAECSYLHEPAPEEDTVTKEEMNPMTGRKEVLQLVYPGGVPRGCSKPNYKGARGQTMPVPSSDSSPSPPPTDSTTQTPSKAPPAWAIPAPGSKDVLVADLLHDSRDPSPDSSPQFVIPTAAPAAWPSLSEIASGRADSLLTRGPSGCGGAGARPSAKDVVTGSAAASKPKEAPKKMMMPLTVAGGKARGTRLAAAKDSGILPPPTDGKSSPGSEHALSTMPSAELTSGRARFEVLMDAEAAVASEGEASLAAPHTDLTQMALRDGEGLSTAATNTSAAEDTDSAGEGSTDADKENTADTEAEAVTPRSVPATPAQSLPEPESEDMAPPAAMVTTATVVAGVNFEGVGEISGALSARDLLPASLEEILEDPVADVKPRASSENGGAVNKASSEVPRPSLDSHVVMPARRKQSRFAFATSSPSKASSVSLPQDLDAIKAPALTPDALVKAATAAPEARASNTSPAPCTARPAFDKSMLPDDIMQAMSPYAQQNQPAPSAATASVRMHTPVGPGTLEQPPMTHESVVQAVSAQLQAIMSQGSSGVSAIPQQARPSQGRMGTTGMADAGLAAHHMQAAHHGGGWGSHQKVLEQRPPEPLPAAELQMLQALLRQELGNAAAGGRGQDQRGARVPLRGASNTSMQHLQAAHAAAAAARQQGLQIKRAQGQVAPAASPAPLKLDGRSCYTMPQQQRVAPISNMHRGPSPQAVVHQQAAALASGGYDASQYLAAASRGVPYSRAPAHLSMDAQAQARLRAVQYMTAPYDGADAAYMTEAGYYSGWEGAAASDVYSMASMRSATPPHQALAGSRQASNWPPRGPGMYWE